LVKRHGSDLPALVAAAYRQAFGRPAADDEATSAIAFIQAQAAIKAGVAPGGEPATSAAIAEFCHALVNANEFLYVD
ncbi:MAG TPA: hypothetical protein VGX76_15590, partial [Pirellulales bacterium]|nr:hypothetical protein [Pirellulales bacterium]